MGTIPTNLDWVMERAKCSATSAFETLKLQIEEDVKKRNDLKTPNDMFNLNIVGGSGVFKVWVEGISGRRTVKFSQTSDGIRMTDEIDRTILEGKLTFTIGGQCKYIVNGEELEFWQVRRKVLEPLFFWES
jgi:hypothetical protein